MRKNREVERGGEWEKLECGLYVYKNVKDNTQFMD